MNVRATIWLWQLLEIGAYFWLYSFLLDQSILSLIVLVALTFLGVRLLLTVVIGLLVNFFFGLQPLRKWSQFLSFVFGEFLAFLVLYGFWQMLPKRLFFTDSDIASKHIIFVHGFMCNNGFWYFLAKACRAAGFSTSAVELPGPFSDIELFAELIADEVSRVQCLHQGVRINIVAFSMGGLASRFLLATHPITVNLITINTPHNGTLWAKLAKTIGATNGRQMCPDSPWLQRLKQLEDSATGRGERFGVWSAHDTIVLPAWRGKPPFANVCSQAKGHLHAAIDFRLHRQLVRLLRRMN